MRKRKVPVDVKSLVVARNKKDTLALRIERETLECALLGNNGSVYRCATGQIRKATRPVFHYLSTSRGHMLAPFECEESALLQQRPSLTTPTLLRGRFYIDTEGLQDSVCNLGPF